MTRRAWLRASACLALGLAPGCGAHHRPQAASRPEEGFDTDRISGLTVLTIGPDDGPGVVVLHEMPGLTPADLDLARKLSARGFRVFVPVLFGAIGQDNLFRGYFQACVSGEFRCGARSARSDVLARLEPLCDDVARRSAGPIGVIGMCLTGILPLALLPNAVNAAVLCQPTVPFSLLPSRPWRHQRADLGLGAHDLHEARASNVPFLTIHYTTDPLCPPERIDAIRSTFGTRVAVISLSDAGRHSTLGSHLHHGAFDDAVTYLRVRLGTLAGPQPMQLARLGPKGQDVSCGLDIHGRWRPAPAA